MRLPIRLESSNSRGQSYGHGSEFKRRTEDAGLFWWTILITFLLILTAGSWIFSLYLFAFPEKVFNYRLLAKLEKLQPIEKFNASSAPTGKFHDARELYQKFYHFSGDQLQGTNGKLKRSYLWNYEKQQPIYVKGSFRIVEVRKLSAEDYFTSGLLVQAYPIEDVDSADSMSGDPDAPKRVFPNAVFEFVFPAPEVPEASFVVGQEITVDTAKDYASVLNIERIDKDHLYFTALPLLYGDYKMSETESLTLAPPPKINVEAPWPISENIMIRNRSATAAGGADTLPDSGAGSKRGA